MTKLARLIKVALLSFSVVLFMAKAIPNTQPATHDTATAGIEKLHRQDIAATLSGDPKALAELWTDDAVRLEPGNPAEIGKQVIRLNTEKANLKQPGFRILSYAPEIKDLKIAGNWAFEWGYFNASYRDAAQGQVKTFRGKLLRVLRKEGDGSWKFARVMWNVME